MSAPPTTRQRRGLVLVAAALALEILMITPLVDHLADKNSTAHFTQHGFIFLGGVLMGYALREAGVFARAR